MWTLYVTGDALYIESLLNALAMLSNANLLLSLAAVGLLVGVIATVAHGFQQDGTIQVGPWFASLIVILLMFSSSTSVQIENIRTGTTRVVANVPLGPAAIGSMISRIGYATTDTIETAFSSPSMSGNGFVSALDALALLREASYNSEFLSIVDDPENNGASYKASLVNYIKDCTMKGLERGSLSIETIRRSSDIFEAIRYDTPTRFTVIDLGSVGMVGEFTCTDAHPKLKSKLNVYADGIKKNIYRMMAETREEMGAGSANNASVTLDEAAQLISSSTVNSAPLVLGSVISRMLEIGADQRYQDDRLWGKSAMVQDSINARVAAWQGESSVFEHFFLPIMSFLEGMVYALAPFAAFGIGLGAKGIRVAGTYVMLAIWVQLWMPVMAIVNHFMMMVATGQMEALHTSAPFPSYDALTSMDGPLQTWLAVASMLGSSVPFLSAAILFGGSQLIGQFGRQVSGSGSTGSSSHYTSPQAASAAPVMAMQGGLGYEHSKPSGMNVAGASSVTPDYAMMRKTSESVSSSSSEYRQASENYGRALSRQLSNGATSQEVFKAFSGQDTSYQRTGSNFEQLVDQTTDRLSKSGEFSNLSNSSLKGLVGAALTFDSSEQFLGKVGELLSGASLTSKAGGELSATESAQTAEKVGKALEEIRSQTSGFETRRQEAVASSAGSSKENMLNTAISRTASEGYTAALGDMRGAKEEYQQATERQQMYQAIGKLDETTMTQQWYNWGEGNSEGGKNGAVAQVEAYAANLGITGQLANVRANLLANDNAYTNDPQGQDKATLAAFARITQGLAAQGSVPEMNQETAQLYFDRMNAASFGISVAEDKTTPMADPTRNQGVGGDVSSRAQEAGAAARGQTAGIPGETEDAGYNLRHYQNNPEEYIPAAQVDLAPDAAAGREAVNGTTFEQVGPGDLAPVDASKTTAELKEEANDIGRDETDSYFAMADGVTRDSLQWVVDGLGDVGGDLGSAAYDVLNPGE